MTAAPPPRDSALDALGFAFGVLRKPGYLWAPMAITVALMLPLLAVSTFGPPPPTMPSPGLAPSQPPFATQAEFEAYFAAFMPALVASIILLVVLGPLASAVIYRLGLKYVDGEPPRPFGPGIVNLAWRYFLQTLALLARLLRNPIPPSPPPSALPEWMNPPTADSSAEPPARGGPATSG